MTVSLSALSFQSITNLSPHDPRLGQILSGAVPVPSDVRSLRAVSAALKAALGLTQSEAAHLLDLSRSTINRDEPPSAAVLDRLYALGRSLEQVSAVIGPTGASRWFRDPHPLLGGVAPLELHRTRYGQAQVDDVIQAMLDGNFA